MATKYFCDACDKEIKPPTVAVALPLANLQFIDPNTGKQTVKMLCADCTKIISEDFDKLKASKKIAIK